MSKGKRTIPRHVDGRLIILRLRLPGLIICFISFVIGVVVLFNNLTIVNLFILVLAVSGVYMLLIELKHRETVLGIIISLIKHRIEKDRYYQRNTLQIDETLRVIRRRENGKG